jgi:hypothetical protein
MPLSPRTLRPANTFTPRSISGLALWLDGSDTSSLYTTDAGPVTAVSAPTEISGCALWLDASDAGSITESGGLVSQWSDKSGNSRHATASTTARPTTGTRTVGGKNALDFNGTANVLTLGGATLPTDATHTVFIVYQLDSASQSRFSTLLSSSPAADQEIRVAGFGSTAIDFYFNGNLGRLATTTALGLGPVVFSAREATKSLRSAGSGVFSSGSGDAYAWAANPVTLGGRAATGWMDGLLCEVIIYPTTLTDSQTSSVEAYLAAKWGISGVHAQATATSDPVGYWGDKSGNARHATQATGANRPTRATSMNGRPSIDVAATASSLLQSTATVANVIADAGTSPQTTICAVMRNPSGVLGATFGSDQSANGRLVYSSRFDASNSYYDVANATTGRLSFTPIQTNAEAAAVHSLIRNGSEMAVGYNGATIARRLDASGAFSATSAVIQIGKGVGIGNAGVFSELLFYNRALTTSERRRVERYLAAKWGITLAPQVSNPDAQDWINRVYANGGTVSASTAAAVNTFCNAIDAASIRDRFYRLNLFCGTGLNACLVPLYRGPSLGGTQFGGTVDTNVGPFVSGDYNEASGLGPASSGKSLSTGFAPLASGSAVAAYGHLSVWAMNRPPIRFTIAGLTNGSTAIARLQLDNLSTMWGAWNSGASIESVATGTGGSPALFAVGRRSSNDSAFGNANGVDLSVVSASAASAFSAEATLFGGIAVTLGGYSIGAEMSQSQLADFYSIGRTLQNALQRGVP